MTNLSGQTILIVDDEPGVRHMLTMTLQLCGAEVLDVATGEEALSKMKQVLPAVVITDLNLPTISGWELLSAMRTDAQLAKIPVIALTGNSATITQDTASGLDFAFDAIMQKPFRTETLLSKLVAVCG